jgi:FtsP/CotA-like multicopper oxidase with cupredoxin domain
VRHNRRVLRRVVLALGVLASLALAPAAESATRHYWIGAVPVDWNIVPSGRDPISGALFNPEDTTMPTVIYKRFTRGWAHMLPDRFWTGDNDGIPGPTIRARVGETVFVHFKNLDTRFNLNHSMHFHGFRYEFEDDGSFIPGASGRDAEVPPGATALYRLRAVRGSAGVWPYHTHSSMMHHPQARTLYGMISIRGKKERKPARENIVVFAEHQGFQTVNGRAFIGNTPTFRARIGERVQWSVMAIGGSHHTFHLHGHRWRALGQNIDTRNVGPAESFRFTIREDVRGAWLYHCHVDFHQDGGMIGLYNVSGAARSASASVAGRP